MKTSRIFFALFVSILVFVNATFAQKSKVETVVKTFYAAIDAYDEVALNNSLSNDLQAMIPISPVPFDKANFITMVGKGFKQAFPDMKHEIQDWFTDGKMVAVKGVFTGTNTGPMQGNPPTGKKAVLPFTTLLELNGDWKIKMVNVQFDNASFMKQLMPDMASADQIRQNINKAYESLSKRDFATFKTLCAADFTEYTAGPMPIKGVDNCIEAYKMYFSAAPDMKFDIKNITLDGNRAIVETTTTGTNTGMVMGMLPATGKMVKTMDVDFLTFDAQGKCTSHRTANPNEFFTQIGYGSLTNPNVGVIMAAYGAFGKGNLDELLTYIDDNATWDASESPLMRICKGKAEIAQFVKDIPKYTSFQKFEPARFIADGDDVVVLLNVDLTKTSDNKAYSVHPIHHFTLKNGKVVSFKETIDTYQPMAMSASRK